LINNQIPSPLDLQGFCQLRLDYVANGMRFAPYLSGQQYQIGVKPMALKKKDEPQGRLGNQGYQEGNEGREHLSPDAERRDQDGQEGKKGTQVEQVGSEAKIQGHRP
jgi:hypothetical protein